MPALPPGDVSVVQFQIAGTAFLQRDLMTAVGGRKGSHTEMQLRSSFMLSILRFHTRCLLAKL